MSIVRSTSNYSIGWAVAYEMAIEIFYPRNIPQVAVELVVEIDSRQMILVVGCRIEFDRLQNQSCWDLRDCLW